MYGLVRLRRMKDPGVQMVIVREVAADSVCSLLFTGFFHRDLLEEVLEASTRNGGDNAEEVGHAHTTWEITDTHHTSLHTPLLTVTASD